MITNPIVFYLASFIIITFAILTLSLKKVINSLLCAIMVFLASAIIFYILGSEYNAIIQAAIYGLAVPIIIGISIMFTDNELQKKTQKKSHTLSLIFLSLIFILAFGYLCIISFILNPNIFNIVEFTQFNSYETILAFAKGIFVNYVWAFELVSILLTIVIVGISLFKKRGV